MKYLIIPFLFFTTAHALEVKPKLDIIVYDGLDLSNSKKMFVRYGFSYELVNCEYVKNVEWCSLRIDNKVWYIPKKYIDIQ